MGNRLSHTFHFLGHPQAFPGQMGYFIHSSAPDHLPVGHARKTSREVPRGQPHQMAESPQTGSIRHKATLVMSPSCMWVSHPAKGGCFGHLHPRLRHLTHNQMRVAMLDRRSMTGKVRVSPSGWAPPPPPQFNNAGITVDVTPICLWISCSMWTRPQDTWTFNRKAAIRHLPAELPWSRCNEASRSASSTKSRDAVLRSPNQTFSTPQLHLDILWNSQKELVTRCSLGGVQNPLTRRTRMS